MTSDSFNKDGFKDGFRAEPLTFGGVLYRTLAMARTHGAAFMRVLLLPVGKIMLGFYGSLAGGLWVSQWAVQPERLAWVQQNSAVFIALLLMILLLGLGLLFQGFWEYLIYSVSLCRNVREVCENRPPDFRAAYHDIARHKKALLARWVGLVCMLLPLLPLTPFLGATLLGGLLLPVVPMGVVALMALAGLLLSGLLGVAWLIVQILLTYGLQALALAETPNRLVALMKGSVRLTRQRPWLTLGLQVTLFLCTNWLFTAPVVALLRFTRLLAPLDGLHSWLSGMVMAGWTEQYRQLDLGAPLLAQLESLRPSLAPSLTDSAVGGVVTLLLLPLGTMAFSLVSLHAQANAGQSAEPEALRQE